MGINHLEETGGHRSHRLLHHLRELTHAAAHPAKDDRDEGREKQRHGREPPVLPDKHREERHDLQHIADDQREKAGRAGQRIRRLIEKFRHDLTGRILLIDGLRPVKDVPHHLGSEIHHHRLRDLLQPVAAEER